jgi:NAD(P)-dependent dehydrogenase (short-subunit alcohol dehydrogenase family)
MIPNSRERVLITGGAAGIGRATAERCRAEGYEVVVIDRVGDGIIADLSDSGHGGCPQGGVGRRPDHAAGQQCRHRASRPDRRADY